MLRVGWVFVIALDAFGKEHRVASLSGLRRRLAVEISSICICQKTVNLEIFRLLEIFNLKYNSNAQLRLPVCTHTALFRFT